MTCRMPGPTSQLPRASLTWRIVASNDSVNLSIDLVVGTQTFYRVGQAYQGPILQACEQSYVTDSSHGRAVTVFAQRCNSPNTISFWWKLMRHGFSSFGTSLNLHMQMTPEDPELFVEMIARAVETTGEVDQEEIHMAQSHNSRSSSTITATGAGATASQWPTGHFGLELILWFCALVGPIFCMAVWGPFLVKHYGSWMLVGINMILYTWMLLSGLDQISPFLALICALNLILGLVHLESGKDDHASWAPVKAVDVSTCITIIYQAVLFIRELRTVPESQSYFELSANPIRALGNSYNLTFVVWMVALLVILWARAFILMRMGLLVIAAPAAVMLLLLLVQVSLRFGGVGGGGLGSSKDSYFHKSNVGTKTIYALAMLTSIVSLVASTFVSFDWLRYACLFTSLQAVFVASSNTFTQPSTTCSFSYEKQIAMGYFTPSPYALMAFIGSAAFMVMPVIVVLAYGMPSTMDNRGFCQLMITAFLGSTGVISALSVPIGRTPLKWNISVTWDSVNLSVDSVGGKQSFYGVVQAYKAPILHNGMESFITDSSHGRAVIVECSSTTNAAVRGKSAVRIQMTPDDPNFFLDMISQATEHKKQLSSTTDHTEDGDKTE